MSNDEKPPDGNIAAALSDLDRFEKQNLNHAATAKRTLRMLPLVEERLQKSTNQDHPTWIEAESRLVALKMRLEGGINAPSTPAALQPTSSPPVKKTAASNAPQPSMISHQRVRLKKIQRDLENQLIDAKRLFNDPSYAQSLDSFAQRMAQQLSPYQEQFSNDPDVVAVTEALKQHQQGVAAAKQAAQQQAVPQQQPTAPPTVQAAASPTKAAAPTSLTQTMISHQRVRLKKMQRDLENQRIDVKPLSNDPSYHQSLDSFEQRMVQQLSPYQDQFSSDPDVVAAMAALNQYEQGVAAAKQQAQLEAVPQQQPPAAAADPPQMISQDRVRILKIKREVQSAQQTLNQNGPKPFQSPTYAAQQEAIAQGLRERLDPYRQFEPDQDVSDAVECLQNFEKDVRTNKEAGLMEATELGDVQAQLNNVSQFAAKPTVPSSPYKAHDVTNFCDGAARIEQEAQQHLALLNKLEARAYLPLGVGKYDMNRVKSLRWEIQDVVRTVQDGLREMQLNLESSQEHLDSTLAWFDKLDPANRHDQANAYLSDDSPQQFHQRLNNALANAKAALAFSEKREHEKMSKRQAMADRIVSTRTTFDANRAVALQLVRMPKVIEPTGTSIQELEQIARDTLGNPKYSVGTIVRLVVNADKRELNREESEVKVNDVDVFAGEVTMKGTKTTTKYVWQEFQVATAEQEEEGENKHYIFYNTLKYFTSGSHTTPLNRWVLGGRFRSVEIPLENIDKD